MKKLFVILLIPFLISSCGVNKTKSEKTSENTSELKGVWLSCYELDFDDKSETGFAKKINSIFSDIKSMGFNTVFVHARSHCDAFYNSEYFPYSAFISGKQGKNPGYDPLKIMCYFAKIHNLQIHAWINPFRITSNTDTSNLSDDNPALKYIKSGTGEVKKTNSGYYFNPSYKSIRTLIINGIKEILENYSVEGIHFDDYFYPTTEESFDKAEYEKYRQSNDVDITLDDFRRENINLLIKDVYSITKKYNKTFGISPHCSFYYNYNIQYADVEKWCENEGYIDYIAPQIYFGFEEKSKTEDNQPLSFKECLEYWKKKTKNKTMYIGLAIYKCGTEKEWLKKDDVISRQINYLRNSKANGFIIFSYSYFELNKIETSNLIKEIKAS